jgi:hypothetical protein
MSAFALRRTLLATATTLALAAASSAHAGLFRAYLSEAGADTNACSLPAPCRLLPAALAAVNDGGEIWILDSANFNTTTATISKSVTILAIPGVVGSFVGNGGDALVVNAVGAKVTLRNLVFVNLAGGGNSGVNFVTGTSLTIRDSSFTGLTTAGVLVGAAGKSSVRPSPRTPSACGSPAAG